MGAGQLFVLLDLWKPFADVSYLCNAPRRIWIRFSVAVGGLSIYINFFLLNCFDALKKKNHIFMIVVWAVLTNQPTVFGVAPPPPIFFCCCVFTLSYLISLEMQYFSRNNGIHEWNYSLSQESLCCSPTEFDTTITELHKFSAIVFFLKGN